MRQFYKNKPRTQPRQKEDSGKNRITFAESPCARVGETKAVLDRDCITQQLTGFKEQF
jgi:hypothetical protein